MPVAAAQIWKVDQHLKSESNKKLAVNGEIRARQVRLIDAEGKQLGIVPIEEALRAAEQATLDLVEIAADADPVVCKIMDFGKHIYEAKKQRNASKKKQKIIQVKEVKFRPKIGKGDFDTKVRHMRDFLEDGHKVKVTLQFRGREVAHPELGAKILDAALEQLGSLAKVETQARLEGRNMTMVLSPDKKPAKKSSDKDEPEDSAPVVENVVQPEETSEVQE